MVKMEKNLQMTYRIDYNLLVVQDLWIYEYCLEYMIIKDDSIKSKCLLQLELPKKVWRKLKKAISYYIKIF